MDDQLHVLFFPLQAYGHMLPIRDMAKLFSTRGVKITIITTPLNAHIFEKLIENPKPSGPTISLRVIKFPVAEAGLPEGFECLDRLTSDEMIPKFTLATTMLQEPLEHILHETKPHCLVADMFYPWATEAAAKYNVPRLVFHGTGFFATCVSDQMNLHKPFATVSSDSEPFVVPNLPHEIKLTKKKMPRHYFENNETEFTKLLLKFKEAEVKSYGTIVNSFYELESEYVDYYRNVMKMKAWHVGPVSIKTGPTILNTLEAECLKWLDTKKPKNSVIYVCFGSVANFSDAQLNDIAKGLEVCGYDFIWVVGNKVKSAEEWMPEGFGQIIGTEGRGLIIRGWAPQMMILEHEAVGGFVKHCGWNSVLEAVSTGVVMVTWPVFADQFYNEKLVVEVLGIGVAVGAEKYNRVASEGVKMMAVVEAVRRVMGGEEAEELRRRVTVLKEKAKKAVEEGGSSYNDLDDLIRNLSYKAFVKEST